MSNNIIDIKQYTPKKEDDFFFDVNIWMYLYFPQGNYQIDYEKKYSNFLSKIIAVKSTIFISSLLLSEFFNTYIRKEFNILKQGNPKKYDTPDAFKKIFRISRRYKQSVKLITGILKQDILRITKPIDDNFEKTNLSDIFDKLEISDFNDKYYVALSKVKGFKIVTHDKDFIIEDVDILTANPCLIP